MFDYTVETDKSINEAIQSLESNLKDEQFGVLWQFDIKNKLQEKGLEFNTDYVVLEVCNPHEAQRVLNENLLVGYFLPCKMLVYKDHETTKIGMPKPTALIKVVDNEEIQNLAKDIEDRLVNVINKSK
ncbi:uncharacterized protein (DUF302 family) [Bacillus mesophilus]|uniref:DUF302 domain-containing protein n=1 Tax=Bacillus mesophilus TaxID=1808955 RepID=A0A6M0QD67_9BACI|nr:DUF302 domain-containing protein [Bacillus mesophilus]MBM7660054.1 uncharacterized protein (DUF302 family) [Bacillus mesophilus]NEY73709.1 DUF302 domain-containing protein [Bacillus mesophilus]